MKVYNKKLHVVLNFPLYIIVIYLIFTLILYQYGPFNWVTYHKLSFWSLNFLYILFFIIGWKLGFRLHLSKKKWSESDEYIILRYLKYLIPVDFAFECIILFRRFSLKSFSFVDLINELLFRFSNVDNAYTLFQAEIGTVSYGLVGNFVTCFVLLFSFFSFNILLLSILYYSKLHKYNKILLILIYIVICMTYILSGTNIGIFRLILIHIIFFFLKIAKKGINLKTLFRFTIIAFIFFLILSVYFDKAMRDRGAIMFWDSPYYRVGGIEINRDHYLLNTLPPNLGRFFVASSSYLTQGYYGMALSLTVPWRSTFGIGFSAILLNYSPSELQKRSYQHRITEFGWEENIHWHTMYTWFANDITFYGVAFIMLFLGILFVLSYKDSIITNNPFAKLIFYYFSLMTFFMPCNNQLFQSPIIMMAFISAIFLWLITRLKITIKWKTIRII